jgi:murein DD-endopeptidase MepM/ murein hydrolase activator NlpD
MLGNRPVYAHNEANSWCEGQMVAREKLGESGEREGTGPHLHFEISQQCRPGSLRYT